MNKEEKYYQCREKDQREPYVTTAINNNAGLSQNYRQNSNMTSAQVWGKMSKFWSGLIQEVEEEYRNTKANGSS